MIVIVDSDGLIGSLNPQDLHHERTQKILLELLKKNARFIYPATTIVETVTFLQGRLNSPELANKVLQLVNNDKLIIEPIGSEILQRASLLMDFKKSKHNTLFDAIIVAIAQKHQADGIFSFDKFYKKQGFKLASEL